MEYDDVSALRAHPAWRLLRADNAPLLISFLSRVFVADNTRSIPMTELISRLDDTLYALRERHGPEVYPKSPREYLEDWAAPQAGWLRTFYPPGCDEVHVDATPAVEKAVAWVSGLTARSFVGTESRLTTVVELLRQIVFGAETDPAVRLDELHRRRAEIDAEIERVSAGDLRVMAGSGQRDRYQQLSATARELLADFREVEDNFRSLDRQLRERIAAWTGSKGELIDDVVGSRHSITESDQGKSFHGFYDFLLAPDRQEEFRELLERVHELDAIGEPDPRLAHIHHDWFDAGERTQATVRLLSEQLRRFLDDQVWLENRRVMDLLKSIETRALVVRDEGVAGPGTELDASSPTIVLPMERPLYSPPARSALNGSVVLEATDDLDTAALFSQVYVDPARLVSHVRDALRDREQVPLPRVLERAPLEQGLAELVGYLALSAREFEVVFDEDRRDTVVWSDDDGRSRRATVPRTTFARVTGRDIRP